MRAVLLALTFITFPALSACNAEITAIGRRLLDAGCYRANARFEVLLPNSDTPVVYDLQLTSAAGDSLSPADYLIDWTMHSPVGTESRGFTAYGAGEHYRYRDGRISEYHYDDDPTPFAPGGRADRGVQCRAQFAEYLPQSLGAKLIGMAADSAYTLAVEQRDGLTVVKGVERVRGYDCSEFVYRFDRATGLPVSFEIEANPGMPSEQTVTMTYDGSPASDCPEINEQLLKSLYPTEFEKYRTDTYALANLPGCRMPSFAARALGGDRVAHTAGQGFDAVTVIAVLDSSVGGAAEAIRALDDARASAPFAMTVIAAFADNDLERIASLAGSPADDYIVLYGARALARDCGVTDYPSMLICRPDGTVADVIIGRNKDLVSDVIQKAAMAK